MTNPVGNPIKATDPATFSAGSSPDSAAAPAAHPDPAATHAQPDLRLFIEKDETAGVFVYRIIDRRTGDVVQQFPREEVLKMKESPDYDPGHVIDAQG